MVCVAVSGARVRNVSKPRGAKAGTVQIHHERVFKVRPARGDLAGEPGNASVSHRWRSAVTGACVGAGPRVPAWAGAAAARQAGTRPRLPRAQQGL